MKRFKTLVACVAMLSLLASSAWVFAGSSSINGKWSMDVVTPTVTGTALFTLEQKGSNLTGMYKGSLGEAPVTGTIKGSDVTFQFTTDPERGPAIYTGKLNGKTMKGDIDFAGVAKGTFDGRKID